MMSSHSQGENLSEQSSQLWNEYQSAETWEFRRPTGIHRHSLESNGVVNATPPEAGSGQNVWKQQMSKAVEAIISSLNLAASEDHLLTALALAGRFGSVVGLSPQGGLYLYTEYSE